MHACILCNFSHHEPECIVCNFSFYEPERIVFNFIRNELDCIASIYTAFFSHNESERVL